MGIQTLIEWCDHTWSPWFGCAKVSPGCLNCYAEGWAKRFNKAWGRATPRPPTNQWDLPVRWNRRAEKQYRALAHSTPAGKPIQFRRPTVFPSSIDWLDEDVPVELLARFLQLIQATPYLKWLLLTKRPELWVERLNKPSLAVLGYKTFIMLGDWIGGSAPANVWLGASVEDQTRADERIPALLKIPAVGRFLSVEPLLGQVRLASIPYEDGPWDGGTRLMCNPLTGWRATSPYSADNNGPRIHWVIIGGESGPGARPCNVDWIRSIVGQCRAAHVAPFVKQLGSRPIGHHNERLAGWPELHLKDNPIVQWKLNHPKGGDPAEWPLDLQGVREFPEGLR